MTHSGGKPHDVGDRGQRYEVTFFDGQNRQIFGWAHTDLGVSRMTSSIEKHPTWTEPQVRDRQADADKKGQ